jgi:hypothetical protein
MQDTHPRWPIPPCLDTSLFHRPEPPPHLVMAELHRGWTACMKGEPWDAGENAAWMEGYRLRLRVELYGAVTPRPVVWPPI